MLVEVLLLDMWAPVAPSNIVWLLLGCRLALRDAPSLEGSDAVLRQARSQRSVLRSPP